MNGSAPRTAHRTPTDEATKRRKRTKRTNIAGITHVQECYKGRAPKLGGRYCYNAAAALAATSRSRTFSPLPPSLPSSLLAKRARRRMAVIFSYHNNTHNNNRNTRGESYILCVSANFFHSAFSHILEYMLRYTTHNNNNNTYSTRYYHYRSKECAIGALGPKRVQTHIKNTYQEHISTAQRPISCISWRSYWSYYIQTVLSRPYLLRGGNV